MNLGTIVAATDFSESSLLAVETAFNLALDNGATVYLLHVLNPPVGVDPMVAVAPPIEQLSEQALDQLESLIPEITREDMTVEKAVIQGTPAKTIAVFAREKEADLIVMATHGRTGLSRLLMGSTAESVLRHAPCKVLVVKPRTTEAPPEEQDSEESG